MAKADLADLLAMLDEETRVRWADYLLEIEDEIAEKGPAIAMEHLEAALEHLLAVGWALRRCYSVAESGHMLEPLGDAAHTVEKLRDVIRHIARKPEYSH